MSSSNGEEAMETCSDSGDGAPAQREKASEIGANCQQMDVFQLEEADSTNWDQDEQVDLRMVHEKRLTNMKDFFDEPVWGHVLGKLVKKTDIENCCSASPFFRVLLREKREREVVLPTVFGILAQRYSDEKNNDESYMEPNPESIPWQRPHRMTGFWKCRLVCRKWNEAIEAIHQNESAGHYQMDEDLDSRAENEALGSKWGTASFHRESQFVHFLEHFEATHYPVAVPGGRVLKKCPFLGRAVRILYQIDEVENKEAYFSRLMELFEKFGDQVWYYQFSWWNTGTEEILVEFYLKVRQMVELMPNLKVLRIIHCGFPPTSSKEELQDLEDEIRRSPFPAGTHLKFISLNEIPGEFVNHLVNQNRQITSLEMAAIEFNGNCAVFAEKLPNLNQLSCRMMLSTDILQALESCPTTLYLKKLHLHLACCPFVRWSRVFHAIGSKVSSDSCTELVIYMPDPFEDDDNDEDNEKKTMSVLQDSMLCRLQLANVQRCKVESCCRFSLDFLLPSKHSLREIKIETFCGKPEWREEQVIKFVGYEDKMEYSNIAKELPRLRKLEVDIDLGDYGDSVEYILSRHYSIQPTREVQVEKVDVRKKE